MASKAIGIFFGTSTGSTEEAADLIAEELGSDVADGPIDIDSITGNVASVFNSYSSLIVGTPTWNTGADTERSGTGWDEVYYGEMENLQLTGKKVAVFGLGDQISYSENYADASGELHDVFEAHGCEMIGYTSQDGYEHEESKAVRSDKFCGLLLDAVNQEEMTESRVKNWVAQLKEEGILGGSSESVSEDSLESNTSTSDQSDTIALLERENSELQRRLEELELEQNSKLLEQNIGSQSEKNSLFTPHYNAKVGRTMWTSADGKYCFFTSNVP